VFLQGVKEDNEHELRELCSVNHLENKMAELQITLQFMAHFVLGAKVANLAQWL